MIALSGGDIVTVLANEAYRQYYDLRNVNVAAAYAGLILLLYFGHAVLGYFQAEPLRTTVELVLVVNLLYWTGWVIERLPRLQAQDRAGLNGDGTP